MQFFTPEDKARAITILLKAGLTSSDIKMIETGGDEDSENLTIILSMIKKAIETGADRNQKPLASNELTFLQLQLKYLESALALETEAAA